MNSDEYIRVPDSPNISLLRFRHFRDMLDYRHLAAVHESAREWDRIDSDSARESIPTADQLAHTFPEAMVTNHPDLLIAEVDGAVVGYAHVFWRWAEITGMRVYLHLCYIRPEWRGKGLGTCLLRWAHQRILEHVRAETKPGPRTFATNVSSTEREADALIQHAGYMVAHRLSDMTLTLLEARPAQPLPEGIVWRPFDMSQTRAYYATWKAAFAPLWTSTPASEEDYQEFIADNIALPAFDPALCYGAWAGDELAGFVFTRIRQSIGRISEVAVHPAWQRRGIAKSLMTQALNGLYERDIRHIRLFTDADDGQGARSLYEHLGFQELKQHIFYRKPLSISTADA